MELVRGQNCHFIAWRLAEQGMCGCLLGLSCCRGGYKGIGDALCSRAHQRKPIARRRRVVPPCLQQERRLFGLLEGERFILDIVIFSFACIFALSLFSTDSKRKIFIRLKTRVDRFLKFLPQFSFIPPVFLADDRPNELHMQG